MLLKVAIIHYACLSANFKARAKPKRTSINRSSKPSLDLLTNCRRLRIEEYEEKAHSRFPARWAGRIRQSWDRPLEVARCLSLVARFELAAIRRVCRHSLRRAKSSFCSALQFPAKQYRRQHRRALVFRLLLF